VIFRRLRRRSHNWTIPLLYALFAVFAGLFLPRFETSLALGLESGMSPLAAVAIYSSIASGMIALTGIVFSLAFVMVQFSATAYSPRLVLWVARDAVLWHAVGIFSGTFLYALAAMAWVERNGVHSVPFFSGWLVIVLLLASVGMFVALIEKVSLLQVHRMLAFAADHGREVIGQTYPPKETAIASPDREELRRLPLTQTLRHAGRPRTVQALDVPALLALSTAAGAVLEVVAAVGDTLVEDTAMVRVFGGGRTVDQNALRNAFALGDERTFEQDPKYAIRLLVDIAIKALSPAVNDPTTAVQALDQIEDLLLLLGRRRLAIPYPTWDDFLILAFDEIRNYGASSVQVMRRMKALVADLIAALPPERHESLRHFQRRLDATIAKAFVDAEDKLDASIADRQGLGTPRKG
jgi:uncharacterized membrane protein